MRRQKETQAREWTVLEAPLRVVRPGTKAPLLEFTEETGLTLYSDGRPWLVLGPAVGGLPAIRLLSPAGTDVVQIFSDPERGDGGSVSVHSVDEKALGVLDTSEHGGVLSLYDRNEDETVRLCAAREGGDLTLEPSDGGNSRFHIGFEPRPGER